SAHHEAANGASTNCIREWPQYCRLNESVLCRVGIAVHAWHLVQTRILLSSLSLIFSLIFNMPKNLREQKSSRQMHAVAECDLLNFQRQIITVFWFLIICCRSTSEVVQQQRRTRRLDEQSTTIINLKYEKFNLKA